MKGRKDPSADRTGGETSGVKPESQQSAAPILVVFVVLLALVFVYGWLSQ